MHHDHLVLDATEDIQAQQVQRNRAWRRKHKYIHLRHDARHQPPIFKPEKKFKFMAGRPYKLKRAMQLGFEYPRISAQQQRLNAQADFWQTKD